MYKKLAIILGTLLVAAIGSLITAYLFTSRGKRYEYCDDDMLFI
jgi:hypothetical protein